MRLLALVLALTLVSFSTPAAAARVHSLKITILSTMLTDSKGVGEWGFSALVEADGRQFLFDTGRLPGTVLANAQDLKIDLSKVTDVVLSHSHIDHVGGLVALREALQRINPKALANAHIGPAALWPRPGEGDAWKPSYEKAGGHFVVHEGPTELAPGVWLTGNIPRLHDERRYSPDWKVQSPTGIIADVVPEDQAMIFDTDDGLVVLAGCAHAGIINTSDYAQKIVRAAPVVAIVGGMHTFTANDADLTWTANELKRLGLRQLLGAHCTGLEAVYRLRALLGLDRAHCVVGAVGASFTLDHGIAPLLIAR
jgi:7,8-dihydropterin-6-yl-methyl-4-(beta-D-ribofuranosyl)aminobenzene 5'-phosphate synthase